MVARLSEGAYNALLGQKMLASEGFEGFLSGVCRRGPGCHTDLHRIRLSDLGISPFPDQICPKTGQSMILPCTQDAQWPGLLTAPRRGVAGVISPISGVESRHASWTTHPGTCVVNGWPSASRSSARPDGASFSARFSGAVATATATRTGSAAKSRTARKGWRGSNPRRSETVGRAVFSANDEYCPYCGYPWYDCICRPQWMASRAVAACQPIVL